MAMFITYDWDSAALGNRLRYTLLPVTVYLRGL